MAEWPVHGTIDGPIVMIGFGSIGKGTLPLIERHFAHDRARMVVIDPDDSGRAVLDRLGVRFVHEAVTRDNYRTLLPPLLTKGSGRGFCVNLSVDTSSLDIMRLCRELGVLYIDTVVEPWAGFYFDKSAGPEARSNYALRETVIAEKRRNPGGSTAVSCCGANPGMVSWFVKQALIDLAAVLPRAAGEGDRVAVEGGTPPGFREPKSRGGLGPAGARPRRQGHPHRRARHPAREEPEADERLRQHLVGRGLPLGGHAAGRARLGHARDLDAGQCRHPRRPAARRRSISSSPAPIPASAPGARRPARNTASWSPTTRRSR